MGQDARERVVILCLAVILCALFAVTPRALHAEEGWRALGPFGESGNEGLGGRVISLAVDPRNPNHVFAGSASGGLWVSELSGGGPEKSAPSSNPRAANWRDAGKPLWHWRYVDTGFPALGVGAIAIDPRDPDILYLGTGEVYGYQKTTARGFDNQASRGNYGIGILRSNDGGKTWTKSLDRQPSQQTGVQALSIIPDPADPSRFTVWAATSEGIYRLDSSKSGGSGASEDWKLSLNVVAASSLSVNPKNPREVVAACGDFASPGHGLYKTRDGGATWTHLVRGLPVTYQGKAELARSASNPETLYVSIGNLTQLTFANNKVDPGADENGGADGITYPENKRFKCLYVPTPLLAPSSYLLRSVDGGDSWETRSTTNDGGYTQGWYANTLAVHPQEPDELFVGYVNPQRSFDGGKTLESFVVWKENRLVAQAVYTQTTDSLIFVDFHAIVYAPGEPEIVYFACDQGVYRSADGGRTIERVNQGFNTLQFYRGVSISQKDRDFIAGVPQDYGVGFLRYRGAGGASAKPPWTIVSGWGQEAGFSTFDDENGIGYFTTHSNRQLGRWRKDEKAPPIDPASAFDPCYIPDVDPYRRSANCLDNTSWNAPLVLAPSNRNRLYAARDVVYRSDKAPIHEWAGLSAADKSIPEKSCTSNDAPGITWAPTSLGRELDGNPVFSLAVAPKHEDHLVIATAPRYNRMNVFESRDAGRTWERITYDLPETGYPMSLLFDPHDATESTLYLTLGGYGFSHVWKLDRAPGAPQKWQDLDGGHLPDVWAGSLLIDPADPHSRHLYVATDRGVYRSADGGTSWQAWSEGLYPGVMSMELVLYAPERLLRLVTHGNGIWQRPLPTL